MQVEFLTRPRCLLCAEARPHVIRAARWAGLEVVDVIVDSDPELAVDFGLRIPVVRTRDGTVLAEGRFSPIGLWLSMIRHRFRRRPPE